MGDEERVMRYEKRDVFWLTNRLPIELIFWVGSLAFIFFTTGPVHEAHFTLCPIRNLGFNFCPGCGLGHSIGHLFRGEFFKSFATHPLGPFALLVILLRIFTLTKNQIKSYGH